MAAVTIVNLTSQPLLLQELYHVLGAGKTMVVNRFQDELHAMPRLQKFWKEGLISITLDEPVFEDQFIREKLHDEGGTLLTADPPAGQVAYITNVTAQPNTFIRVNAANNAINVSLPLAASNPNAVIHIKNIADTAYLVSLIRAGSDTIDGDSALTASGRFGIQLRSDGISNWMIH